MEENSKHGNIAFVVRIRINKSNSDVPLRGIRKERELTRSSNKFSANIYFDPKLTDSSNLYGPHKKEKSIRGACFNLFHNEVETRENSEHYDKIM